MFIPNHGITKNGFSYCKIDFPIQELNKRFQIKEASQKAFPVEAVGWSCSQISLKNTLKEVMALEGVVTIILAHI